MTDHRVYWVWLQHAFGPGSSKPYEIHRRFAGGVAAFHEGGAPLWNSLGYVSEKEARRLYAYSLEEAAALLEYSEKLKHQVVTPECEKYPEALRHIFDPPAVLYVRGELPDVDDTPAIAVVGTRKPCRQSELAAKSFGYQLAISGAVLVSGIAVGVDAEAHKGALQGMGKSICVLPCGNSQVYPVENYSLRERIAEAGAVISEYPLDTGVMPGAFQVRNRLLSGLCCGTLVVEAAERSGALITAKHAKEQSRDVFAFPGEPGDPRYIGCTRLIRDGAKAVTDAAQILEEYSLRFAKKTKARAPAAARVLRDVTKPPLPAQTMDVAGLSAEARLLLQAMDYDPLHISALADKTGLSAQTLLSMLTELELQGCVRSYAGKRYSLP